MQIVIDSEAWLRAALGGGLIGTAAALLWALNGRIAGISGVLGGLLWPGSAGERSWRLAFVAGLLIGPWLLAMTGQFNAPVSGALSPLVLLAGLLVGFGTRLGSGCTSGHGVCGLARFSPRSAAATGTFMGFGFLTVWLLRHGGIA